MNTDKLLKAIQILVKEEVKQQLPALIKEGVKAEVKRILAEQIKPQPKKENSGLSMAKAILGEDKIETPKQQVQKATFTKNPVLNDILNETRQQYAGAPSDTDFRTINFGQGDMGSIMGRSAMAEKMGYGDFAGVNVTTQTINGAPVNPNNEGVQDVMKAMNRDYSELVKRFNKK